MDNPRRRKRDDGVISHLCHRFGAIAVHEGFVTIEEMKAAIMEQIDDNVSGREHRLLGTILYDRGLITDHQIETVLREIKKFL